MKNMKRPWIALFVIVVLGCVCPPGFAMDEAQVQKSFESFERDWVSRLNAQEKYGEKNIRIEKAAGGALYVARYDIIRERAGRQIQKTTQPATPYIGSIRYEIWTCSAYGTTEQEARAGKFECELQNLVMEIFRFNGKDWVY